MGQLGHGAVLLAVELREHEVPVLEEAVAVASGRAIRTPASHILAHVVIDLGAGAARAGRAGRPEVIVLAETADVTLLHPELLPDLEGLVVIGEHREVEALDRQMEHLGRELERPGACLLLRNAAKREVAEHLEERSVAPVGTDDVDIVRAHALLARGRTDLAHGLLALIVLLELVHARIREKQRGVVGDERGGREELAPALLEEGEERRANLSGGHRGNICCHGGISLGVNESQTHKVYMKQAASGCAQLVCAAKSGHRTHSRLEAEGFLRSVEQSHPSKSHDLRFCECIWADYSAGHQKPSDSSPDCSRLGKCRPNSTHAIALNSCNRPKKQEKITAGLHHLSLGR